MQRRVKVANLRLENILAQIAVSRIVFFAAFHLTFLYGAMSPLFWLYRVILLFNKTSRRERRVLLRGGRFPYDLFPLIFFSFHYDGIPVITVKQIPSARAGLLPWGRSPCFAITRGGEDRGKLWHRPLLKGIPWHPRVAIAGIADSRTA